MIKEYLIEKGLFTINMILLVTCGLLLIFLFSESLPIIKDYGLLNFIFGINWAPDKGQFGIFPMMVSSTVITLLSLVMAIPLSVSCAVFLEEIAPAKIKTYSDPLFRHWQEFHL